MAACSDWRGIAWEHESERFDRWTQDFRLVMGGVEVYAEVKRASEFPMDVAQRALGAGRYADALILGMAHATPGAAPMADWDPRTSPSDRGLAGTGHSPEGLFSNSWTANARRSSG